jgi:hypothetical protein
MDVSVDMRVVAFMLALVLLSSAPFSTMPMIERLRARRRASSSIR